MDQHRYCYRELAAFAPPRKMVRKRFITIDDEASLAWWRSEFHNTDVFVSMALYDEPHLNANSLSPFVLDIDASQLEEARASALLACELLMRHLHIEADSLALYFSGRKGFHVIVDLAVFGQPTHQRLLEVWRRLAQGLHRQHVQHIDLGLYSRTRLLRLVNSRHGESQWFKVPLAFKELQDLGLDFVLETARQPRDCDTMAIPTESPKAMGWLQHALTKLKPPRPAPIPTTNGWRLPPCVRRAEQTTLQDGERHHMYYTLARAYASTGMHQAEAYERLCEVDERHPIHDQEYLTRVIHNAWKKPGVYGCPNPTLQRLCVPQRCYFRTQHHD